MQLRNARLRVSPRLTSGFPRNLSTILQSDPTLTFPQAQSDSE